MHHYIIPPDPTSRTFKLNALRARARRRGYWITRNPHMDGWSLVDSSLRRPLVGLHSVNLVEIARAISALPINGNSR